MLRLIEIIDHIMLSEERKKREHHYPSDGVKCSRQLWYSWNDYKKSNPIEPAQLCKIRMGNSIHNEFANILKEFEPNGDETTLKAEKFGIIKVEDEVKFQADIGMNHILSGRIDGVITLANNEKVFVELKSSFGRGIREIKKNNMPGEDHLAQTAMYLRYNPFGVTKAIIIYIARDDAYRTEFFVELKDDGLYVENQKTNFDFDKLLDNFREAEGEKIPDRKYKVIIKNGEIKEKCIIKGIEYKSDWQCRYCVYRDTCWEDVIKKESQEKVNE